MRYWSAPSWNTVLWYGIHTPRKTVIVLRVSSTVLPASSSKTTRQDVPTVRATAMVKLKDLDLPPLAERSKQHYLILYTLLSQWEFTHEKFG